MNFGSKQDKNYRYYNSHEAKGYTYVDGIGFAPPPPEFTEKKQINRMGNSIGAALLLYLILGRVVPNFLLGIFSIFMPAMRVYVGGIVAPPAVLLMIDVLTYIIVTLLPFLLYAVVSRIPFRVVCPNKKVGFRMTFAGVSIGLGVSVIGMYSANLLYNLFYFTGRVPTMPDFTSSDSIWGAIFVFLQVVILAPILEEFVFRGIIMQSMRRFGDTFALFMSAMIFSLIHANFIQSPNAFLMGIVLGYFVLRCGSLRIGIYIHIINNLLSYLTDIIGSKMSEDVFYIIFRGMQGVYSLMGIVGLLFLLKRYQNFFSLNSSKTVTNWKEKSIYFITSGVMLLFIIVIIRTMSLSVVPY